MGSPRVKVASVVLVSMLGLTVGPLCGRALAHMTCETKHHTCAEVPVLTRCCCGDHADISVPPATMTDRHDDAVAGPWIYADAIAVTSTVATPSALARAAVDTSPPFSHSLTLPILFSDLRL